jgi:hypothetical protein
MPASKYEIEVHVSREEAWEKLRDFSAAIHYVPGLTSAEITTEQHEGVGTSRRVCQGKRVLNETVTEWHDGQGFTLRLHRGEKNGPMPPLTEVWYDYGLLERDGKLFLSNRMRYEIGLGFLGQWLDKLGIGKILANAVRDSTIAQKIYYETGTTVTPEILRVAKIDLDIAATGALGL